MNGMVYVKHLVTQKIEMKLNPQQKKQLDLRSRICLQLYNRLLVLCEEADKAQRGAESLLTGNTLNNMLPSLKKTYPELRNVYSSVLKHVVFEVKKSLCSRPKEKRFTDLHFLDPVEKWFYLFYGDKGKGYKVISPRCLRISLSGKERIFVTMYQDIHAVNIEYFSIVQKYGRYFALFQYFVDIPDFHLLKQPTSWISLDQNHENFFMALDSRGITYRFNRLLSERYFNKQIDSIVDKMKECGSIKEDGELVLTDSKRWRYLNRALYRLCNKRKEQTFVALHTISKWLTHRYDCIIIGNYLPQKKDIPEHNMEDTMLQRSHIGRFRKILKWDCEKRGKEFRLVDERGTTATCCLCGAYYHKDPKQRTFICYKSNTVVLRDLNACVNIARKGHVRVSYVVVDKIDQIIMYDYQLNRLKRIK